MDCERIARDDPRYPGKIEIHLTPEPPEAVFAAGDTGILDGRLTALFCSTKCPGRLLSRTYDLAQALRDQGRTVIGGFHTPMEKECLAVLLRSPHPVVVCPARGLASMRADPETSGALRDGRLLLLSPFPAGVKRATAHEAARRNLFAAALADEILVAHAPAGSGTERLARAAAGWGKPLYTLADEANENLRALGARPFPMRAA